MDIEKLLNVLEQVLSLGDKLDAAGGGIAGATGGSKTTREVCRLQLMQFLFYLAHTNGSLTDGQVSLLNIVLQPGRSMTEWEYYQICQGQGDPTPETNLTLKAFIQGDAALSAQSGAPSTQLTDILISTFETFGQLIIALDDNAFAKVRCNNYIEGMRSIVSGELSGTSVLAGTGSQALNRSFDGFEIEDGVLTNYTGDKADVVIPRGVTRIDDDAFFGNTTIETVTIPEGVTRIGDGAFWRCENLKEVRLPEGLTKIEENVFNGCKSIETIELPSTVTGIGHDAFGNCDNLKRIKIPAGLTDIGEDVLYDCDKLEAIIVCGKKRSEATLKYLKGYFPEDLVFWQGDPQESAVVGQLTNDSQTVTYTFAPGVILTLPSNEYTLELIEKDAVLHGGDLKVTVRSHDAEDDNSIEFMCAIDKPWGSGDDVFDKIDGWYNSLYPFNERYQTQPASQILINGIGAKLNLRISKEKALRIELMLVTDEDKFSNALDHMMTIWRGLTFGGRSASLGATPPDSYVRTWLNAFKDIKRTEKEKAEREHQQKIDRGLEKYKAHTAKYNDMFSFSLPAGSELIWKDADDGSKVGEIALHVLVDDDGDTDYEGLVIIRDLAFQRNEDGSEDQKSVLDVIADRMPRSRVSRICDDPPVSLFASNRTVTFIGAELKYVAFDVAINYAQEKVLTLSYSNSLNSMKEDKGAMIRLMLDCVKNLRMNGKPLTIGNPDCDEIGQKMIPDDFEEESSGQIGVNISFNGKTVAHIDGDGETGKEEIPLALPQVDDLYHEHYTLVTSGTYTTRRDADFVGQPIRKLMEKCGSQSEDAYDLMQIPQDNYKLDKEARKLAKVFRLEEALFDPYTDTEGLIRLGMFADARMFHALRSLAWTVCCKADREGKKPRDYDFEYLQKVGDVIAEDCLHYVTDSYCSGLCSHYDWRVFYVPDAYKNSSCAAESDLRVLCGKENRSGNSTFMFFGGSLGHLAAMHDTNKIISRNEETLESLEALRKDLADLLPVMKTIYNGFMQDRDRSEKLEGPLADALTAWCALAIAAKEPFYSEEANDSYECDAGLEAPLKRPTDKLEDEPTKTEKSGAAKTSKPAPSRAMPQGEVLDLGGATVIAPGQFNGNMTLRNIVIPEGVTEIGEYAFYTCMFLESVVFPKSLRKIGKMAFMSCRNLKLIELPEGVEEIETHAFGATNNLKEVHLPDSLKVVDSHIFGMGGDSPYATAYLSGDLARRLYDPNKHRFLDPIYARHLIIDGKAYESFYAYIEANPAAPKKAAAKAKASKPAKQESKEPKEKEPAGSAEAKETGRTTRKKSRTESGNAEASRLKAPSASKPGANSKTIEKAGTQSDCITFGLYPQMNGANDKTPIEWTVLKRDGSKALVISRYGLDTVPYNSEMTNVTWENCTLRAWLNRDFLNAAFTSEEQSHIISTRVDNGPDSQGDIGWSNNCGNDTTDKVFLLSCVEANTYFDVKWGDCNNMKSRLSPTAYASERGAWTTDQAKTCDGASTTGWWLRSLGPLQMLSSGPFSAAIVKPDGPLGIIFVDSDVITVRPVMWIDTAAIKSGTTASAKPAKAKSGASPKKAPASKTSKTDVWALKADGKVVIEKSKYMGNATTMPLEIPEGIVKIEQSAFSMAKIPSVKLPKSLRTIESWAFNDCPNLVSVEMQEGLEEIGSNAFSQCPQLREVKLPSTIRKIDRQAFVADLAINPVSNITLHLSGVAACAVEKNNPFRGISAVIAGGFVIDGNLYPSLEAYVKKVNDEEKAQLERERAEQRARAEHERRERERREAAARKDEQRSSLQKQIRDLEAERDATRGLFSGGKRKKLQARIDELNDQLRRMS